MLFQKRKCSEENSTERLKRELETADAVLIGAGAGLSTSAGLIYTGERFHQNFNDFEAKYGFHDMYSGGFYPFSSLEEHWAYGSSGFASIITAWEKSQSLKCCPCPSLM